VGATVLSNDSFQEFHGEHAWLFDPGRLMGGTPVPGIGWIFVPRSPVRGPKSRIAVRDSRRTTGKVERAIAAATKEAVAPADSVKGSRKKKGVPDVERRTGRGGAREVERRRVPQAVNDPLTFISFVADHPLGATLEAEVDSFTSHGAVVLVGDMRCYVPLSGLGDPPPRSAREVLKRGERRAFVLTALDPHRRGVELALPDVAVVSGKPTDETVEAEVEMVKARRERPAKPAASPKSSSQPKKRSATPKAKQEQKDRPAGKAAPAKKSVAAKKPAAAKKAPAKKPGPAKGAAAPAKKANRPGKSAAPAQDAPAKKAAAVGKAARLKKAVPGAAATASVSRTEPAKRARATGRTGKVVPVAPGATAGPDRPARPRTGSRGAAR
jgi:hypothetical protein